MNASEPIRVTLTIEAQLPRDSEFLRSLVSRSSEAGASIATTGSGNGSAKAEPAKPEPAKAEPAKAKAEPAPAAEDAKPKRRRRKKAEATDEMFDEGGQEPAGDGATMTKDDFEIAVRKAVTELGAAPVKAVFTEYKAKKIADVKAEHYATIIGQIEALKSDSDDGDEDEIAL